MTHISITIYMEPTYTRLRYSRKMKAAQSGDTAVDKPLAKTEPNDNRVVETNKSSGSKDKSK